MLITFIVSLFCADSFAGDVHVKGYYRADGTYVEPHYRSAPNSTTSDNWSTIGNVNPHTGKIGTKIPNDVIVPGSLPSVPFVPQQHSSAASASPLQATSTVSKCQSIIDEWRRAHLLVGVPPTQEDEAQWRAFAQACEPIYGVRTSSIATNRGEDLRKFEYCIYMPASSTATKIVDVMKCNVGQELEMKKCLLKKSDEHYSRPGEFVHLTDASQCWLDAHQ